MTGADCADPLLWLTTASRIETPPSLPGVSSFYHAVAAAVRNWSKLTVVASSSSVVAALSAAARSATVTPIR